MLGENPTRVAAALYYRSRSVTRCGYAYRYDSAVAVLRITCTSGRGVTVGATTLSRSLYWPSPILGHRDTVKSITRFLCTTIIIVSWFGSYELVQF